ncbi:MAG: polymerase subunit gamma and tau [Acidobacteria bacterium]|nr:polymerase subunit gamma and tau [Acidobacteriota bacterium]
MSYQVIARKWRPQSFAEVTGQEPITRTLRNAIEHERLHHAYLFSGARGVGKTTTARLLAKALNCHKAQQPTATPCRMDDPDACPSCKEISESRSIDVQEIDAASHTGIDNVRETIIGSIGFAPARDRYKVFVIDEVHMLSTPSFNALLKTIEEPPPRVVFIMATTEQHKVPETILSRCQQFEFRTIATTKILERLRVIADSEKISIPEDALREIARAGEGSMRDAQSAFDQVISFAGETIKKEDVELALGVAGADLLTRVINGIADNKPVEALAVVDDLVMRGHDLRNFCRDMLAHFRDLLIAKVSGSDELLESAVCERGELNRQASLFSESDLVRFFHSLSETETKLRTATHPRYQIEIGLVKLMEMRRLQPLNDLIERIGALEESLRTGQPPAQTTTPAGGGGSQGPKSSTPRAVSSTPKAATSAATAAAVKLAVDPGTADVLSAAVTSESVIKRTESVTATVTLSPESVPDLASVNAGSEVERIKSALEKKRRMFLVTALEGARLARVEGNEFYIEFALEAKHLRDTLAKSENVKIIREACQEVTGKEMGVRITIKDDTINDDLPMSKEEEERREKQTLRAAAEQNPVVQQVLRKFRGEIVDVQRVSEA